MQASSMDPQRWQEPVESCCCSSTFSPLVTIPVTFCFSSPFETVTAELACLWLCASTEKSIAHLSPLGLRRRRNICKCHAARMVLIQPQTDLVLLFLLSPWSRVFPINRTNPVTTLFHYSFGVRRYDLIAKFLQCLQSCQSASLPQSLILRSSAACLEGGG